MGPQWPTNARFAAAKRRGYQRPPLCHYQFLCPEGSVWGLTCFFLDTPAYPEWSVSDPITLHFHLDGGCCMVATRSKFPIPSGWPPAFLLLLPGAALAQSSPFNTGATSLLSFALTIATPIAALIVIGLAIAAAVGKVAWGWVIGAIVGIAAIFGAPQIVTWIRGLFAV